MKHTLTGRSRRGRLAGLALAALAADARIPAHATDLTEDELARTPRERLCCSFGYGLAAAMPPIPLTLHLENITSPEKLAPHAYVSKGSLQEVGELLAETYGLAYTCRGGFVDVAHVSDFADWTAYLSARIRRTPAHAAPIVLPCDAGTAHLTLRELEPADGPKALARSLALAQRIAYQLSVMHEVTSWYDVSTFSAISEKVSAFSPEDNYSNLLGTYVGREAVLSAHPYDESVTATIRATLARLAVSSVADTRAAFDGTDGTWWDRTKVLPDPNVTRRRNLEWGPDRVTPWRVPQPPASCGESAKEPPEGLEVPSTDPVTGGSLAGLYELELHMDRARLPKSFPFPRESAVVTPADFPALIEAVRTEIHREYGADADKP
ncbi:MAG: DUF4056 domain-containing protein [Deltaproteobacteria bacterium]|nr:DUF4056 domain-containing protein [Deltaproteobacteria bacterium]